MEEQQREEKEKEKVKRFGTSFSRVCATASQELIAGDGCMILAWWWIMVDHGG